MLHRRVRVFVAEQAQQRAVDPFGQIDRRHRLSLSQPRGVVDDDIAAPAVNGTLDQVREFTRHEIGLAPARAETDYADLAAGMRLRTQEVDGAGYIAEHLLVRYAAAFADLGHHRFIGAVADPELEARRHRGIAVMDKFARHLAGPFVPARHMMDHDDAGMRPGAGRMRVIGIAAVPAGAAVGRHTRLNVSKSHGGPSLLMPPALFAPNPSESKPPPLRSPPRATGRTEGIAVFGPP